MNTKINNKMNKVIRRIAAAVAIVLSVSSYGIAFAGSDSMTGSTSNLKVISTAIPTVSPIAQETLAPSTSPNVTKEAKKEFGWSEADGGVSICNYFGKKKHIALPEEYQGEKVVEFDPYIGFGEMKTIFIPKTVKRIVADEDDCHFCDCSELKAINVDKENPVYKSVKGMLIDKKNKELLIVPPKSVIKKLVIPKGVKKIHAYAIQCTTINTLVIRKEVKKVHPYALFCKPTIMKLGGGVKVLNENCFGYQVNLKKLVLKNGIQRIGNRAFASSKKLKKVVIPKSVKYVAIDAFPKGCKVIRK